MVNLLIMTNFLMGLLKALRLPVRLVKVLVRKRRKPKLTEREKNQKKYVWNFAPGRLKNVSWGKGYEKGDKGGEKRAKKANNWTSKKKA